MRNALHEQLLKAGLIDEQRLQEAEREKRRREAPTATAPRTGARPKQRPQPAKGGRGEQPGGRDGQGARRETGSRSGPASRGPVSAPAGRDEGQAVRRALEREIVALIKANRHPHNDGDEIYNFVDGPKIGRIYCTADTQRRLAAGELAVVRLRSRYAVVPTGTATGIAVKAPGVVLVANARSSGKEEDDPAYASHPVPDDLRW